MRAALAMTAALAQAAQSGNVDAPLVYDLDGRRVVTADEQLRRVRAVDATTNLDTLVQNQIAIHRYDGPAGTRLLTLNLHAFGLADLAIDDADPADAASLAPVLARAAAALHHAVVEGSAVAPLHLGAGAGELLVDLVRAPRQDDDPDNIVYRLVPATAALRERAALSGRARPTRSSVRTRPTHPPTRRDPSPTIPRCSPPAPVRAPRSPKPFTAGARAPAPSSKPRSRSTDRPVRPNGCG